MSDPSLCSSVSAHSPQDGASRSVPWSALAHLIRLPNQTGTLLLMLPTFWSLVLASHGTPSFTLLAIFAAGSFLMRSAGVVLNDIADRSFDRQVARTQTRPLASGALSLPEAFTAGGVLLALAAGLLLFLNPLTVLLSPIAVVLAAVYPFSKRIIQLPQAILGMAFGWGAIMAWAAVQSELAAPVWLLYAATICWAMAYDSIYALQDREDDMRIGVKSSAILFGPLTWLAVGIALGLMLILLGIVGWLTGLNVWFYSVLALAAGFSVRQVVMLRKPLSPDQAFTLFKQHVWIGLKILAGIWLGFL